MFRPTFAIVQIFKDGELKSAFGSESQWIWVRGGPELDGRGEDAGRKGQQRQLPEHTVYDDEEQGYSREDEYGPRRP